MDLTLLLQFLILGQGMGISSTIIIYRLLKPTDITENLVTIILIGIANLLGTLVLRMIINTISKGITP